MNRLHDRQREPPHTRTEKCITNFRLSLSNSTTSTISPHILLCLLLSSGLSHSLLVTFCTCEGEGLCCVLGFALEEGYGFSGSISSNYCAHPHSVRPRAREPQTKTPRKRSMSLGDGKRNGRFRAGRNKTEQS